MIARLGDVIGWTGNTIAAVCLLGLVLNRINGGDPMGAILFAWIGVPAFLIGQACRYILAGPR